MNKLATQVSDHLLTGRGEFPYQKLRAITISYLNKQWFGNFDEDDVSDILGQFWIDGRKYHNAGHNPIAFLLRVAFSRMHEKFRRRGLQKRVFSLSEIGDPDLEAHGLEPAAPAVDLDAKLDAPTQEDLEWAIGKLFVKRRDVARLSVMCGMEQSEIAEVLGVSVRSVQGKLMHIRSQLSTLLANRIGERNA